MRRSVLAVGLATALSLTFVPAAAIPPAAAGVIASSNIDHVITIPDVNAIGAKIIGDYMYVTTIHGVRIYDVSEGVPLLTGALDMPNWENESVDTNGDRLLVSADGFVLGGSVNLLVVVDVSNKNLPIVEKVGFSYDGHTATCIADCKYAWTSGNDIINLDSTATYLSPAKSFGGKGYTHNWNVDAAGLAWGSDPWGGSGFVVDTNGYLGDPLHPQFLNFEGYIGWHNSIRPNAELVTPTQLADGTIDKGEVLYGAGEDLYDTIGVAGNCTGQDRVTSTWFYKTGSSYKGTTLATWSVGENGTMSLPNAKPTSATFCSSHWLDESKGLVAVGWYEQGTRILDVSDPSNIRQIGYFMPVETQTWAAYFKEVTEGPFGGGTYIYTIDLVRGIDVFKIDATAGASPTVLAPYLNASVPGFAPSERFGWACRIPAASGIEN